MKFSVNQSELQNALAVVVKAILHPFYAFHSCWRVYQS